MSDENKKPIVYKESPWGWVFMGIAICAMSTCTAVEHVTDNELKKIKLQQSADCGAS